MSAARRGLLDTSAVIDLDRLDPTKLPDILCVSAITLAELAAGPHATGDGDERARRMQRLQLVESTVEVLPFDAEAARAYGLIYARTVGAARTPRSRLADLLIAATALAHDLSLVTRNPADVEHLAGLVEIIDCGTG